MDDFTGGLIIGIGVGLLLCLLVFIPMFHWGQEARIVVVNNEVLVSFHSGWGHTFKNYNIQYNALYRIGEPVVVKSCVKKIVD